MSTLPAIHRPNQGVDYKRLFSLARKAAPNRLHFAAHSHHLWPDAALAGHMQAWDEAIKYADDKWSDHVFAEAIPEAQKHVAKILGLTDTSSVVFAPNTHEFVLRLLSCFEPGRPLRILTTDSEFHSFHRQWKRINEPHKEFRTHPPLVEVEVVHTEPFRDFDDAFLSAAKRGDHDLIYVSQVFFDSAYVFERFKELALVASRPQAPFVVIDGYHGFCAIPTDLSDVEDRLFYLAGGYKYAMSGENVCFMHCPPGYGSRPANTGWFAGFEQLSNKPNGQQITYHDDARRFAGATFDPVGIHRFNAVMRMMEDEDITVESRYRWVRALQEAFLEGVDRAGLPHISSASLIPDRGLGQRGHFLTFRLAKAEWLYRRLHDVGVITDSRGDRFRIGFSLYNDLDDVHLLVSHLTEILRSDSSGSP